VHFHVLLVLRHGVDHIARLHFAETEASRLLLFAISIAIVIGVASLSYYLEEHPARRSWRNAVGTIVPQQAQIPVQAMPDRGIKSIKMK
jgi:peptidoglycan/LPS O-acetylase OafA/YrhL